MNFFVKFLTTSSLLYLSACSFNTPSHQPNIGHSQTTPTVVNTAPVVNKAPSIPPATSAAIPPQVSQTNIERFYVVHGRRYGIMKSSQGFVETGTASWYGDPFHGRKTSNGEVYDMHQMTAAHKHLPLPSYVEVTNTLNGKKVVLRVNDRGPFVGDRVIDLSFAAAKALDIVKSGTGPVHIRALDDLNAQENKLRINTPDQPAFIQVASFTDINNAFTYQKRLINNGINNSRIVQTNGSSGKILQRVQIGPLNNGQEYDNTIKKLQQMGINNTLLVRE